MPHGPISRALIAPGEHCRLDYEWITLTVENSGTLYVEIIEFGRHLIVDRAVLPPAVPSNGRKGKPR
jgi:hypothetical protein